MLYHHYITYLSVQRVRSAVLVWQCSAKQRVCGVHGEMPEWNCCSQFTGHRLHESCNSWEFALDDLYIEVEAKISMTMYSLYFDVYILFFNNSPTIRNLSYLLLWAISLVLDFGCYSLINKIIFSEWSPDIDFTGFVLLWHSTDSSTALSYEKSVTLLPRQLSNIKTIRHF